MASSDNDVKGKKCYKVIIGRKRSPDSSSRQQEDLSRFSRNVRATMPCTLLPKVVRTWGVFFSISTLKSASCHSSVQFFISHLPRWPCARRFSKPNILIYFSTLRNHKSWEKNSDSWLFYLFARLHHLSSDPFFWLFLFSDLLSSSLLFFLFSSLILPTSVFSSVHTVGSLTFKLLSATCYIDMHAHTSTHTYIHAHEHKHLHQDKTRQHKDNTI